MRNSFTVEEVHRAIKKSNGSLSGAARLLGCEADYVRKKKQQGQTRGLKYPPVPATSFTRCEPDPTPEQLIARRDAINAGWTEAERAKRVVGKVREVEIPEGVTLIGDQFRPIYRI